MSAEVSLAGVGPRVVPGEAGTVVAGDEVEQSGSVGDARVDAREHDRHEVVALDGVDTGGCREGGLVLGREGVRCRAARAGEHGAVGGRACLLDELRVVGAVGRDEGGVDPGVTQLLDEGRCLGVVAGVEDRVGLGTADDLDGRGEVFVTGLDRGGARGVCGVAEARGDLLGETDAVVGVVGHDADLCVAEGVDHVLGDGRTLDGVVGETAVEGLPPEGGEVRVGGRGGEREQARLVEDVAGRLGLARERGAEEAEDVRVADDLRCDLGGLLRVSLGVEGLEDDLAVGVGLVVLVERELCAVEDVLPERGVRTGQRTGHRDGGGGGAGGAPVTRGVDGVAACRGLDLDSVGVDLDHRHDGQVGRG